MPAAQVGGLSADAPEPVWPCNQPILALYQAMPWAGGSPCWPLFPELARMWRIKRPDRPDALLLLQACEAEHRAYIKETDPTPPT